jgi:hypothetical protein
MIRKLKALGVAFTVVLAISAIGASAAPAASFHAESPTLVSGMSSGFSKITTDPGSVSCLSTTFSGNLSTATSATMTVTPNYGSCTLATIFGNISVTVDFKGCDYHFNASGHLEIRCPFGNPIVISGPGCTITIPAQTLSNAVSYGNTGAGSSREIDFTFGITGLKYSYSGFTCGSGTNTTNGTHSGNFFFFAAVGIWRT